MLSRVPFFAALVVATANVVFVPCASAGKNCSDPLKVDRAMALLYPPKQGQAAGGPTMAHQYLRDFYTSKDPLDPRLQQAVVHFIDRIHEQAAQRKLGNGVVNLYRYGLSFLMDVHPDNVLDLGMTFIRRETGDLPPAYIDAVGFLMIRDLPQLETAMQKNPELKKLVDAVLDAYLMKIVVGPQDEWLIVDILSFIAQVPFKKLTPWHTHNFVHAFIDWPENMQRLLEYAFSEAQRNREANETLFEPFERRRRIYRDQDDFHRLYFE